MNEDLIKKIKKHPVYEEYPIIKEEYERCYKPFDIVQDEIGNVGFIESVNFNTCNKVGDRYSYSICWIIGTSHSAWHHHESLKKHCNLMIKIAVSMCCPSLRDDQERVSIMFKAGI
jgi:hypothetical protein